MALTNSLAKEQKNPLEISFKAGSEEVRLTPQTVKRYLVSGDAEKVTAQEVVMFMNLCKFQHLNPFLHEAYLIKYGNKDATLIVGKAAFEKRATRCERYRGFEAGIMIINANGELERRIGMLVLHGETLVGGWADVYVEGFEKPVTSVVSLDEYIGRKGDGSINAQWRSKPATMIRKVAKVQALREAFPEDFCGMYIAEEKGVDEPIFEMPVDVSAQSDTSTVIEQPGQVSETVQDDFANILEG
jgi:phage recombination protein Bet